MSINSRTKGKVGEREFAKFLRDRGFQARRGQQFSGGNTSPDVISNIPNIHWEIKRVQNLNIDKAMAQAIKDADGKIPVVAHRKNNKDWLITISADAFLHYVELSNYNKVL